MVRRLAGLLALFLSTNACSPGPASNAGIYAECVRLDGQEKFACINERLLPVARTGEVQSALEMLANLADTDSDVMREGHLFAHSIGIASFDPTRDFASAFLRCSALFQAGCYHGLIQASLAGATEVGAETINALCASVLAAGADRWTHFQCLHGMGHGLLIQNNYDLLKALDACELMNDPAGRVFCHGGAFMENAMRAAHPGHSALTAALGGHASHGDQMPAFPATDPDDPHYPCSIVKVHQKSPCYGIQTAVILHLNGYDFGAAADTCEGAPEWLRALCHQSLGRDVSGIANRDPKKMNRLCGMDRTPNARHCYAGAAKSVIDWRGDVEEGLAFCRTVRDRAGRARCSHALGQQAVMLVSGQDRRRELCARAGGDYRDACLWGAGLIEAAPPILEE